MRECRYWIIYIPDNPLNPWYLGIPYIHDALEIFGVPNILRIYDFHSIPYNLGIPVNFAIPDIIGISDILCIPSIL